MSLYGTPDQTLIVPIGANGDQRVALADVIITEIQDNSNAIGIANQALALAQQAIIIANEALADSGGSGGSPVYADTNEIWIANTGTDGDGTLSNPYRCPDSQTLGNLFANIHVTNLTIHFLAGTFLVPNPGIKPLTGWKFKGAGIGNTILKMDDYTAAGIAAAVIYNNSRTDGVEVSDMTIDCNGVNQTTPGWVAAVRVVGSYIKIERVLAINWFADSAEAFVIAIGNDLTNPNYNPIIRECIVTQPASLVFGDGVTAISIHDSGSGITGFNIGGGIYNCFVYNVSSGGGGVGEPVYFHAFSDIVEDSYAANLTGVGSVAVYRDSAGAIDGYNVRIKNNTLINVTFGVYYNMPSGHMTNIIIENNYIQVGQNGWGILYYRGAVPADPPAWADGVQLIGNVIIPYDTTTVSVGAQIDTARVATVQSNVFQGIGGGADFTFPDRNIFIGNATQTGPLEINLRTVAVNTSLDSVDEFVLVDATAAIITITLPLVADVTLEKIYTVKKIDASGNAVTIAASGGELIDGLASNSIGSQYTSISLVNNGTGWSII